MDSAERLVQSRLGHGPRVKLGERGGSEWSWREARRERRRTSGWCGTQSGQLLEERGARLAKEVQEEDGREGGAGRGGAGRTHQ